MLAEFLHEGVQREFSIALSYAYGVVACLFSDESPECKVGLQTVVDVWEDFVRVASRVGSVPQGLHPFVVLVVHCQFVEFHGYASSLQAFKEYWARGDLSGLSFLGWGESFLKIFYALDLGDGLVFLLLFEVPLHEGVGAVCRSNVTNDFVQLHPLMEFVLEVVAWFQ